jgi:RNA polymerase sigma-70 factor (ECF subfamily)
MRDALTASIPNLRAFAISLSGNVQWADDLVQETLVKAWRHHDTFEDGTNLKAWLFTILRNTFFSECRKYRREIQDIDSVLVGRLAVHAEQQGHLDMADFVAALGKLSADQREALTLVGAEGFSYEEAALIAGTEVGTIKSRVSRARTNLAELLGISSAAEFGPDACADAVINRPAGHRRA